MSNLFVRPGVIEGFSGPMASGKSKSLLGRVDSLRWIEGVDYIGFKPEVDIRDKDCRSSENFIDWIYVSESHPEKIFDYVKDCHGLVAFDEAQFFSSGIVDVVLELQSQMKNVVFAGLDFDFRGEAFGSMKELMFNANELTKLYAVCGCGEKAYYTQRLVDGKPARYDAQTVSIEGESSDEKYVPRCFGCYDVPGKK